MTASPEITIVTAMRNEGPFVVEWVAHHRALGVTRILVFSNDCDDGTDALLDRLEDGGAVTHVRHSPAGSSVQWSALKAAKGHEAVRSADWCLVIDCDEFVNLRPPLATLSDLIAACPDAEAIVLPWRLFGHSGHLGFEDMAVTSRFVRAIPDTALFPASGRFFKTFYRVAGGPFAGPGVHRPKTRTGAGRVPLWYDGSGNPLSEEFAQADARILLMTPRIEADLVQLNHYSVRSAEDFLVKRARGLPNRTGKALDTAYWAERNFNTVEDASIAWHATAAAAEQARLLALPGVAEAHAEAVARHRTKIAALLATPEGATLFSRLALVQTSVPPPPDVARRLLALVHAAGRP